MNTFWEHLSENALDQIDPIAYPGSKNIRKKARIRKPRRIGLRILIAAVLVLIASVVCYAAVEGWRLQPPQVIDDVPPVIETPYDGSAEGGDIEFDYAALAGELLGGLGVDTSGITPHISTEYATRYARQQIRVAFDEVYICFDAADKTPLSGALAGQAEAGQPVTEQQALAAAQEFYDSLPFPEGYVYAGSNRIDEEYGLFSFTRSYEITIGGETLSLVNPHEEIRITVNFLSGRVESWNSFYFPLLDDHTTQDTPVSETEAIDRAAQKLQDVDGYTVSATVSIALPNYMFTDYFDAIAQGENYVYPSNTRFVWLVSFEKENELFTDQIVVYVDYYTGEILGGDLAK